MFKTYDIDSLDNRDPDAVALFQRICRKPLWKYFRPVVQGVERIPKGSGLYVANHSGGLVTPDSWIFCSEVLHKFGLEELPYGLGHEVAISLPGAHQIIVPLGAVRASAENAHRLFASGKKVLVYPGGDIDVMRSYRDRERVIFGMRRGYIRLALREEVPIIPVVSAGSHSGFMVLDDGRWLAKTLHLNRLLRMNVFPVTLSIPWGLTVGIPLPYFPVRTRIHIEILDPIVFERYGEEAAQDKEYVEACHQKVHSLMETTLYRLCRERDIASGT